MQLIVRLYPYCRLERGRIPSQVHVGPGLSCRGIWIRFSWLSPNHRLTDFPPRHTVLHIKLLDFVAISMTTSARLRLLSMVLEFCCQNHGFPYNHDLSKRSSFFCVFNMLPVLALCQSLSASLNLHLDQVQSRLCRHLPLIQLKGLR